MKMDEESFERLREIYSRFKDEIAKENPSTMLPDKFVKEMKEFIDAQSVTADSSRIKDDTIRHAQCAHDLLCAIMYRLTRYTDGYRSMLISVKWDELSSQQEADFYRLFTKWAINHNL